MVEGVFCPENEEDYITQLKNFNNKDVEIVVRKPKVVRSGQQNKMYWSYLTLIGSNIGEEPSELHDTFKAMFLQDRTGRLTTVRSTASLTTIEFTEYIEKIKRKVAEMGIYLPDADDFDGALPSGTVWVDFSDLVIRRFEARVVGTVPFPLFLKSIPFLRVTPKKLGNFWVADEAHAQIKLRKMPLPNWPSHIELHTVIKDQVINGVAYNDDGTAKETTTEGEAP